MSIQVADKFGNQRIALNTINNEVVIDTRPNTSNIALLNAEVFIDIAGEEFACVDVRGVFVATMIPQFTIDGINWMSLPIFNRLTETFQQGVTAVGAYQIQIPTGSKKIRLIATAYTSGTAIVAMTANVGNDMIYVKPIPSTLHATVTAAAGVSATLSLPGVAGMYHYITNIKIEKFAATTLTAGAAPIVVTTSNLNGGRVYSIDASAQVAGTIIKEKDVANTPIKSTTPGSATTFVAPLTANVIWRISVDYYLGL
jgi:hypothetical protein